MSNTTEAERVQSDEPTGVAMAKPNDGSIQERAECLRDYSVREKVEQSITHVLQCVHSWAVRLPEPDVMGKNGTAWLPTRMLAIRDVYFNGQQLAVSADHVWALTNRTYACDSASGRLTASFALLPSPHSGGGWVTELPDEIVGAALQILEAHLPQKVRAMAIFQMPKLFISKV